MKWHSLKAKNEKICIYEEKSLEGSTPDQIKVRSLQ